MDIADKMIYTAAVQGSVHYRYFPGRTMKRKKSVAYTRNRFGHATLAMLLFLMVTTPPIWANLSAEHASAAVNAAEEEEWETFRSEAGAAIAAGDLAAVQKVVDEALREHPVEGLTWRTWPPFVNLQILKGRVHLLSEQYEPAKEAFEAALRQIPVGLIGGPWVDIHYGLSISYWRTGFHAPFDDSSDFYTDGDEFPDNPAMHHFYLLFVEEQGQQAYEDTVRRYRDRGYDDAELEQLDNYAAWIREAFPAAR